MDILTDLKSYFSEYFEALLQRSPRLILAILLTYVFLLIMRLFRKRLFKYITEKAEDKLTINFFNSLFKMINVTIAVLIFLFAIGQAGIARSILGAATISSIVIGFAFKDIAENFLAGVIMAFRRPFRLGDTVMTGDVEGTITEMSLRDTHIKTFDGKDVYVPNGQIIKSPLYNYTIDGFLRKNFSIGIDYKSDIDQARKIILTTVQGVSGVLHGNKGPKTFIKDLGQSSIVIEVQYWVNTFDNQYIGSEVKTKAIQEVLDNLTKAEVHMPGDIIEVKNYSV